MTKYSKEFKEEVLKLSDEIVKKKAAAQFGLLIILRLEIKRSEQKF